MEKTAVRDDSLTVGTTFSDEPEKKTVRFLAVKELTSLFFHFNRPSSPEKFSSTLEKIQDFSRVGFFLGIPAGLDRVRATRPDPVKLEKKSDPTRPDPTLEIPNTS